jgi:hypothetical protein
MSRCVTVHMVMRLSYYKSSCTDERKTGELHCEEANS